MKNKENILLEKIGKQLPFSVPKNYFNEFALQIEEQIGYKYAVKQRIFKSWMYMAAMFIGVLIMGEVFYSSHKNNLAKNADNYESYVLSQVDESSLVDYYVEHSKK